MTMFRPLVLLLFALALGCGQPPQQPQKPAGVAEPKPAATTSVTRIEDPAGLHNVHRIGEAVYSGSEPHGEEGFASLEKLGIKTVISVDGARPDLETAHRHGIQYVHIPIGYDGVTAEAGRALARAAKDSERPIYVHCHHGKHRGPAATAVLCAAEGTLQGKDALKILEAAGTGKQYAGLWRDVEAYTPPAEGEELPTLVEVADVGSLAAAMAQLDRHADHLELIQKSNWTVPPDHPDLVARQEAVITRETLREAARLLTADYGEEFKSQMTAAETVATDLEVALRENRLDDASGHLVQLRKSCNDCHTKFRN